MNNQNINVEDEVKKLLELKSPLIPLDIIFPTRNKFYSVKDPSKPITLRPLTFEDEQAVASIKGEDIDAISILIGRCLGNLNVQDLLVIDKLYALIKLREISYGKELQTEVICPHCGVQAEISIDTSKFAISDIDESIVEPIEIELKDAKIKLKARFPRVKDSEFLKDQATIRSNLWRFVTEIEGHTLKDVIVGVLNGLNLPDIKKIIKEISLEDVGINTSFDYECHSCKKHSLMAMPLNERFFEVN